MVQVLFLNYLLILLIYIYIQTGNIPDDLKMARVVPIHKKNIKTDAGNYRPISVLSIISKYFKRVVFNQLNKFLIEQHLLNDFQSGF